MYRSRILYYLFRVGCPQISKNLGAISKSGTPEGWHEASSTLRTLNSGMTWESHCYLTLSDRCMWNDVNFCTKQANKCNYLTEHFIFHCTKFSHLRDLAPRIYAPVIEDSVKHSKHMPYKAHVLSSLHVEARNQTKSDSVKNSAFLLIVVLLRTYCRSTGYRILLLLPLLLLLLLLLPLALQSTAGFRLSNNVLPFFPICHQLSPSSHSQHLKSSFYFRFPSFPGSSPSSRPFQFLSEDRFGHPILNSL